MNVLAWIWANLPQICSVITVVGGAVMWIVHKSVPSRDDMNRAVDGIKLDIAAVERDCDDQIAAVEKRVAAVEQSVRHLATKDDINQVLVALERQDGKREALNAKVEGISALLARFEHPLDLMQDFLLRSKAS